ncbi:MAG: zf-HC2 domain-containing protein [Rhodanobacteraceae bacterium]
MRGRVLHFESPAHREVDALLPWLVNGTLTGDERERAEQHLSECVRCQRELEWLRELRAAGVESATAASDDMEVSLQRMRNRLDAGVGRRSLIHLRCAHGGWRRAPLWARWAIAAQLVLSVALAAVLIGDRAPAPYHTLGVGDAAFSGDARLAVVFDPSLSERDLRQLLQASGARIVDGPNATGAYVLAVPPDRASQAVALLRVARGVWLAEDLSPPRGR